MTRARTHVGVEVGDGLVARFGDALVLVAEPSRYSQGTEEVLEAVESMASEAGSSGARIAVRLAAMITGPGPGGVPPFGVVAPTEDAYVVLLHGPVWVEVTGPDGVERFSGEQAVTWVDRRLGSLGDRLTMGSGEGPVSVDPRSDLRAGLVPGSGFVLTAAAGGRGADLADAAASHGGSFQPSTTSTDPEPEPAPAPVAERAPMAQPAPVAQPGPVAEAGVADVRATGPSATGDEVAEPEAAEPGPDDATVSNVEVVEADGVYYGGPEPAVAEAGVSAASPSEAGPSEAGPSDAGPSDAGPSDAGPSDAGPSDAGPSDVGHSEADAAAAEAADLVLAEPGAAGTGPDDPTVVAAVDAEPSAGSSENQSGGGPNVEQAGNSWWQAGPAAPSPAATAVPMGNLVSPDGMSISLDRDYVLGREPESDPSVARGAATAVRLNDDDNLISRVQSYITVQGGQVTLKDAASANGTYVAAPGAPVWTRLGADRVVLPPTWSMRVGNRVFTYMSP